MPSANYWSETLASRVTRRRALAAAGTASVTAVLALACGKDGADGPVDKSGLLSPPADTTKNAKRGGILRRSNSSVPPFIDAHRGGPQTLYYELGYHRLFSLKPGYLEPSKEELEGALAESWEWSPDRTTITAKLRPNVKFHNIPPVNGRPVDVQDHLFSWQRFQALGSNRLTVANSANPDAPIVSMTAPDSRTIVVKLKEPIVYANGYLTNRGYVNVVPREAESQFDLRSQIIGTGHFYLSDFQPDIGLTFKRNPDYWEKDRPYVDQINFPIIPEYASALAQFRTGAIYDYPVRQADVLTVKRELPELRMYDAGVTAESRRTVFGWQDARLRDKRVRQALSMALDRDIWIDAQYNTDTFTSQGLPIEKRWNTALQATDSLTGWWLDPKGKDFGPNARYFQYNVAEAKKLLAAAGYSNGVEIKSTFFTSGQNGADYVKFIEVFEGMVGEAGVRLSKNIINYNDYLDTIRDSWGRYEGLAYKLGPGAPSDDAVARLVFEFSTTGGIGFHGFDAAGRGDQSGDPYVEEQLKKAKSDFDTESRRKTVHDLQRYLADQMYTLRWPGGSSAFQLVWPVVKNYQVWIPGSGYTVGITSSLTWWLDETQAPVKKG